MAKFALLRKFRQNLNKKTMVKQKAIKTLFSLGVLVFGLLMFGAVVKAGWEMEIIENGGSAITGYDNVITTDSTGNPHVFYTFSNENYSALKYAKKIGTEWQTETVAELNGQNVINYVGKYMSAAMDSNGNPHVIYSSYNNTTNRISNLIYAEKTNLGWQTEEVANDYSFDVVNSNMSLKIDSLGKPHISYQRYDPSFFTYWVYAHKDNNGVWQKEDIPNQTYPYFAAVYMANSSLTLDSSSQPHIAFVNRNYESTTERALIYAIKGGDGTWSTEVIDVNNNTGYAPSLILDATNNPQVSYYNLASKKLKYATKVNGSWQAEDVATIIGDTPYTSTKTSIGLDKNGDPCIAYLDQTDWYLKYASKIGNAWQIELVSSYYFGGRYAQLVFDNSGNPHISYTGGTAQGGDYIMQYAHYIPEETFVTKTELTGAGQASGSEKLIQKTNEYLTKNFVFSFLKLPKKLQAKKYYIKTNKYAKYPAKYANAKKKTLKKYWKVTTNLKNYKAGKAKNKYSLRLMFAYDQSEFKALQKQNKKLKEKQLKLKYYNTTTKKWTNVPKVKQNTTRNFFHVTLKDYKYPLNTKFAIGK